MSVVSSRHRPMLVALSVLLGVALAGGSVAMLRGTPSDDESLRITVPDVAYRPVATPFPVGAAPLIGGGPLVAPQSSASAEPGTSASPPSSSETPEPRPSTSSTTSAPVAPADSSVSGQVLALVNEQRADAGCGALSVDNRLVTAAREHSEDMSARGYFSHTTPEGVTFGQRIENAGYPRPGAENIARGSTSATRTMTMWMNSDRHRRNILNCSFTKLGVGLVKSGWYWTQNFGY